MKTIPVFLLISLFLCGSAWALNFMQSENDSNLSVQSGHKTTICDVFDSVQLPTTHEVAGCDEATKAIQKRAWHWQTQALGGGIQAKSCGHFQKRAESLAREFRSAAAQCKDSGSVGHRTEGAMLVRDTQADEVRQSGIAKLDRCIASLESVLTAANNQTVQKRDSVPPFKDPFTAEDLAHRIRQDLAKMRSLPNSRYQDPALGSRCAAAREQATNGLDRIGRSYGDSAVRRIFAVIRDQASAEKVSAIAARNALLQMSGPGPLENSDPRWAR